MEHPTVTEIDDDSQSGAPSADKEPIVLVRSSDSESNDESSVRYTGPPKSRRRMYLHQSFQDNFSHLENKLFTAVFDISTHLGKMVHVQAEIVKTLKGMNDRMDALITIVKKDKDGGSTVEGVEIEDGGVKRKVAKKNLEEEKHQTQNCTTQANGAPGSSEEVTPQKKTPRKQTPLKRKQEQTAIVEGKRSPRKLPTRKAVINK